MILFQSDVSSALIMKRVEAASGAKYSSHKEQPRKFEPIAPVGTTYTPVGKVDIAALKKAPTPAAKPALPTSSRPTFGAPTASAGSLYGRVGSSSAPTDAWPDEKKVAQAVAPPPPAASRPPTLPTANRPAFSSMSTPARSQPAFSAAVPPPPPPAPVAVSNTPTKPAEEDRIEPAKSAYTPVNLPAPKKLKNPFAAMEQQSQQGSPGASPGGAKKLTWTERQALAKKQQEEEEARSRSAAYVPPAASPISKPTFKSSAPAFGRATVSSSGPRNFGAIGGAVGGGAAVGATAAAFSAGATPPVPPPPPPVPSSYSASRNAVQDAAWGTEEEEVQPEAEPEFEAVSISF